MKCLLTFFTIFGIIAFIIAAYHFAIDQYGIYQINKENKKQKK